MNPVEEISEVRFPKVGEESLAAIQEAVRQALIEHHKAGQPVPTWRDGKVVWVHVDENGRYADEA